MDIESGGLLDYLLIFGIVSYYLVFISLLGVRGSFFFQSTVLLNLNGEVLFSFCCVSYNALYFAS